MNADERKALFEEQGYLVVESILSQEEVEECQSEIRRLHEHYVELDAKSDPGAESFQREPYANEAVNNGLPVLRKIENTRDYSEVFKELASHPRLVEVLNSLLGPDLLLFRSTLMLKPAFHGSVHGLHQDSAYWPMEPPSLVTVSIALNDSSPENGCFHVIPESHKWGLQNWGRIARDQNEKMTERRDIDTSKQIEVPLTAGSVLFFHSLMVHGSGSNQSPSPRNTALYAYFPPSVRYTPGPNGPQEKSFPVASGLEGRQELTLVAQE